MALAIHIASFISGGYTGESIRWDLHEKVSGVKIDEHEEAGPHGQVYNFSFVSNIRDIVYEVRTYSVPPGGGIGTLEHAWDVTVSTSTVEEETVIEIIVGGGEDYDPDAGATSVIIEALIDRAFRLEQRGIGHLFKTRGIEYEFDNATGEISLLDGATFNGEDRYVAIIAAKYVVNPPGSQQLSHYSAIEEISVSQDITSADFGKLLIVEGVTTVITLTFDPIADIIEGVPLEIESIGNVHRSVVLQAAGSEVFTGQGRTRNKFILGRGEKATLVKVGAKFYFFCESPDIRRAAQFEWGDYVGANRVVADGTEANQADYPRVVQALNEDFAAGQVLTSSAAWSTSQAINGKTVYPNKGFFALYSVSGVPKVRFPDHRNLTVRAVKNVGGVDASRLTNLGGGYQHEEILLHGHKLNTTNGEPSANPLADPVRGTLPGTNNTRGEEAQPGDDNKSIGLSGGVEQITSNHGKIPLIII